jgi:hypothetical protein
MKIDKQLALKSAIHLTPQYVELFQYLKKKGGRFGFSSEFANIRNKLGSYVRMYDDERKINCAFLLFLMGEEGFKEFNADIELATPEEQQEWLNGIASLDDEAIEELFPNFEIPKTAKEWQDAKDLLAELPELERKEAEKRSTFLWCFVFSSFFNTLSLMVHGSKLTTLVPMAMAGNELAFLKAIQIDSMLLIHHPYFRDRKLKAQNGDEPKFLAQLLYRESNSPLRGKIQYPALYMLFGVLEACQWLDDLKHDEILDIVDAAALDRFQNKIEDVGYLTKRLLEYRRWQKLGI